METPLPPSSPPPSSPPPPPPSAPAPPSTLDADKMLAILCHVSLFLGVGFILPLIVYLVKRDNSPIIAAHAKEVLNFHLSMLIYCAGTAVLGLILCCIPIWIPIYAALGLTGLICSIVGAIKASENSFFYYPITIRFIT